MTKPQLCVSILPKTTDELFTLLPRCADADVLELRLDALSVKIAQTLDWSHISSKTSVPLLVTFRCAAEGGFFTGSEAERAVLYQAAIDANVAYIDIESESYSNLAPLLKRDQSATRLVLSHHIFLANSGEKTEQTYEQLRGKLDAMAKHPADVYKLIFTATSLTSALTTVQALEYMHSRGLRAIVHAMGEFGEASRIIGTVCGAASNAWTYTALDASSETASGQITFHEARSVYRLQDKSLRPQLYGLLGFPTKQSKGKFLHNTLAKALPKDNDAFFLYLNFPTPDAGEFWRLWRGLLHGFSVTIPHKESIYALLDRDGDLSDEARRSGVCNTAVKMGGRWKGFNTDALALEDCLSPHTEHLNSGTLVIGTGATTQSVVTALQKLGIKNEQIFITGRNTERGRMFEEKFGCVFVRESDIPQFSSTHAIGGIVQTTPIGMVPTIDAMPVGRELFREGCVVMDVIYNPVETRFLREAQAQGCITISGEEMFIRQAAHQFALFTGKTVEVEAMRRVWTTL